MITILFCKGKLQLYGKEFHELCTGVVVVLSILFNRWVLGMKYFIRPKTGGWGVHPRLSFPSGPSTKYILHLFIVGGVVAIYQ
jgi:hypothetical protein